MSSFFNSMSVNKFFRDHATAYFEVVGDLVTQGRGRVVVEGGGGEQ